MLIPRLLASSFPLFCIRSFGLVSLFLKFLQKHVTDAINWVLVARPRLMDFVKGLDDAVVESASRKAFAALPDLSRAITELTVLKGVGPATASAVLAAYAPDVAPFMSDEAMVAALGNAKDYTLKQYLAFADKLQAKSKELTVGEESFTPSDVERALWSSAIGSKSPASGSPKSESKMRGKRKR
ncbi:hypothetical protein SETIT_9G108400v2 [Setaria italica]|uniref:Uncharacterized protein n=1 Tax=Setaria italica TaxID=4555 RepID=A0A368SFE7_SETIT|nr:hypothetical protein SETIT_9G108400v2 [Setaria italica]